MFFCWCIVTYFVSPFPFIWINCPCILSFYISISIVNDCRMNDGFISFSFSPLPMLALLLLICPGSSFHGCKAGQHKATHLTLCARVRNVWSLILFLPIHLHSVLLWQRDSFTFLIYFHKKNPLWDFCSKSVQTFSLMGM